MIIFDNDYMYILVYTIKVDIMQLYNPPYRRVGCELYRPVVAEDFVISIIRRCVLPRKWSLLNLSAYFSILTALIELKF